MKALRVAALGVLALTVQGQLGPAGPKVNAPPGVETWCGKAFKTGDSAFDPGGRMSSLPRSPRELLDLRIYPRHNIYLANDVWGGFVFDARIGDTIGEPYCDTLGNAAIDAAAGLRLNLVVFRTDTGQTVVERVDVPVNGTGIEAQFRLSDFLPRKEPYEIIVRTVNPRCAKTYQSTTKLYRLPSRSDGGNSVRLDLKYGGIAYTMTPPFREAVWKQILPYSFYVDWGNYMSKGVDTLQQFANQGYNVVHPVPGNGVNPWGDWKVFDKFLDSADKLGIYVMYDMRWTYKNVSLVREQIERYKNRKSILTWYTGDEPDGNGDPLDAPAKAYDAIKLIDPYRPVSLVLNCDDYHFKDYSAGADIVLTDPYPIGINAGFSVKHGTPCNATYGDCGCDNCNGELLDVGTRIDRFRSHQDKILTDPKVFWGVPQAFGGEGYWSRVPSAVEEIAMAMLFINHGATGVVAWNYPTTQQIAVATSALAKALGAEEVTAFLLGTKVQRLTLSTQPNFDAAAWRSGKHILFSIVYLKNERYARELRLGLGVNAKAMKMLWPPDGENWFLGNKSITKPGMAPLEANVFLVETE